MNGEAHGSPEVVAGDGRSGRSLGKHLPGSPPSRDGVLPSVGLRHLLSLIGLAVALYLVGLTAIPLVDPDEGRYAEIAIEMLNSGDFITPHLNGVVYLEKPPLYYWLEAASIAAFGPGEFGFRLCSVVLGLAGIGLAGLLGFRMGNRRVGRFAAVILASSPLYAILARLNIIDMTVSFFLTACLACFWWGHGARPGWTSRLFYYGMFVSAALAVLSKGLIGLIIPCGVIGLYLLITGRLGSLRQVPWISGTLLFLALALPWHILAAQRNPGFLHFYFVREHFLRFATPLAHRDEEPWFFIPVLVLGMLPWIGLSPRVVRLFRSPAPASLRREGRHLVFLAAWAGFIILFFSLSRSKLVPYILPACAPLALLLALALDAAPRRLRRLEASAIGMVLSNLAVLAVSATLTMAGIGFLPRFLPGPASPLLLVIAAAGCAVSGLAMVRWFTGDPRAGYRASVLSAACLVGAVLAAAPQGAGHLTARDFARALKGRLQEDVPLLTYGMYPQSLPVYLGRRVGIAGYRGELLPGIESLPEPERSLRFPTDPEFMKRWNSGERLFVVTDGKRLAQMRDRGCIEGRVLLRDDRLVLVTNHWPSRADHRPSPVGALSPGGTR